MKLNVRAISRPAAAGIWDSCLTPGFPFAKHGEWILDNNYRIDDIDLTRLWKGPENKITVYKVAEGPLSSNGLHTKSDELFDVYGGLYYVGYQALERLSRNRGDRREMFREMCVFHDVEATVRRYPFDVAVLHSKWDSIDRVTSLIKSLKSLYRRYNLSVHSFPGVGNIVESHSFLLRRFGKQVLVIDADFEPNGEEALMYEPVGLENNYLHLWNVRNPVNGLVYGHGSPKLINPNYFDAKRFDQDMTLDCNTAGIHLHDDKPAVGTHAFHHDLKQLGRTTCREVYKLIKAANAGDLEAAQRLTVWVSSPLTHLDERQRTVYRNAVSFGVDAANSSSININDYEALEGLDYANPQTD